MVTAPGAAFEYGPSHLQIFNELLRRKTEWRSTVSYIAENVSRRWTSRASIQRDGRGNPLPASGFELTAREWARFGELIPGPREIIMEKQIVPSSLLAQAFTVSSANPSYGSRFWLNRQARMRARSTNEKVSRFEMAARPVGRDLFCRAAPSDMVVALAQIMSACSSFRR